ncbi:MAG: hypothetical protein GY769_14460 [bacterium]|nr:hypothetical protein [bacterium]
MIIKGLPAFNDDQDSGRPKSRLTVSCAHLQRTRNGSAASAQAPQRAPTRITFSSGDTSITVAFCDACAERLGAVDGDRASHEIAALVILRQDLEARLESIAAGLGEVLPLLNQADFRDRALATAGESTRHDPNDRRKGRTRLTVQNHQHLTADILALDFDEGGERLENHIYRRANTCSACREALEELSRWLAALDHCDPVVAQEFLTRHDFFNRLLADHGSHHERIEAVRTDELYHQWGLARLLMEESRASRSANPELSAELAELALAVAGSLDPGFYRTEYVSDLIAEAAANYADTLRALDNTEAAEILFEKAASRLELGTGRARIASGVARLEARLLKDQGRQEEAHELLERAIASHEEKDEESRTILHWILASLGERSDDGLLAHGAPQDEAR